MNYWELRKAISKLVPRRTQLELYKSSKGIKEKGRKSNYHQFNLETNQWEKQERLLNVEEMNNFMEVSLRASACPMPFNLDVWDGLICPYNCIYCYANSFRSTLYTSFFDNSKSVGLRYCNPDYFKREIDKLLVNSQKKIKTDSKIQNAINMRIPMRLGIRFEDFLNIENRKKISLNLLKYLAEIEYPVMINTKSNLVGSDEYVKVLSDNPAKSAVHITLISSNSELLKSIEPGAPSYEKRLDAMARLSSAGVRVVARIEPYMVFINDNQEDVYKYMEDLKKAGVDHITFDTYSYSARNYSIMQNFYNAGYDFERMFLLTSDSQALGSLLLSHFMILFREKGFNCSTFDLGNVTTNDDWICCEVGSWFTNYGFNYGSVIGMIHFLKNKKHKISSWSDFSSWVENHGGFLSEGLRLEVKKLWNLQGDAAFFPYWSANLSPSGWDQNGIIWNYDENSDFRKSILEVLL